MPTLLFECDQPCHFPINNHNEDSQQSLEQQLTTTDQPRYILSPFSLLHSSTSSQPYTKIFSSLFVEHIPLYNLPVFPSPNLSFPTLVAICIITRILLLAVCDNIANAYPNPQSLEFLPSLAHSLKLWLAWVGWLLYILIFMCFVKDESCRRFTYHSLSPSPYSSMESGIIGLMSIIALFLWFIGFILWWIHESFIIAPYMNIIVFYNFSVLHVVGSGLFSFSCLIIYVLHKLKF